MSPRPAFWRYTAFQTPGWALATIGGWWLHHSLNVPVWVAVALPVIWVIKDYVLYPVLRFAYEADHRRRIEHLIGARGTTVEPLNPNGYVRVRGELWQATSEGPGRLMDKGGAVEVVGTDGMVLIVRQQNPSGRITSYGSRRF